MHQKGLLKAIRYFGSEKALGLAIAASQQQISYWLNGGREIGYDYVLKIESVTEGYINRYDLAPTQKKVNTYVDSLIQSGIKPFQCLTVNVNRINDLSSKVIITEDAKIKTQIHRPLLLNSAYEPIIYPRQLYPIQRLGQDQILVKVFDLESLIQQQKANFFYNSDLLLSERLAIGEALKSLIGERRGRPNKKMCRNCDTFKGRSQTFLAKLLGLHSKETYARIKYTLEYGTPSVIVAMDEHKLTPAMAEKLSRSPEHETTIVGSIVDVLNEDF